MKTEIQYSQSKFAHVLKVDNTEGDDVNIHAIYHALNMETIFINEQLAKLFRKIQFPATTQKRTRNDNEKSNFQVFNNENPPEWIEKETWKKFIELLISKEMLVEKGTKEESNLKNLKEKKNFSPAVRIRLMYLQPTYECNLECKYCSVVSALESTKSKKANQMMVKATAFRAIDVFFDSLHPHLKNYKIIFYGGEPLLNWPVLEASLEYITIKNDELLRKFSDHRAVKCALLTNGTLIDRHIADALKKYNCSVSLSIDGPQQYHDKFRVDKKGEGSFQRSLQAIEYLREANLKPAISCTLPSANIENIDKISSFFQEELSIQAIGFNPVRNLPVNSPYLAPIEKTTAALLKAFNYFRQQGIYEDRIMRKVNSFVNKEFYIQDCAGYGCQIAVGPQGEVGPCHLLLPAQKQIIGSVFDSDILDKIQNNPIMATWAHRKPLFMELCQDCVYLGICGGGCAAESLRRTGDLFALDTDFCNHTSDVLDWLIRDLYLKSKKNTNT
ncbi:MAG: radical SAM protein [Candidatus Hodarchaeales archaeon]